MRYTISASPRRVTLVLALATIFFSVVGTAVQSAQYLVNYRGPWIELFSLDRELNLPAWYASFSLLLCGWLLFIIAAAKRREADAFVRHWQFLAWVFFFLALDEAVGIHESLIFKNLRHSLPAVFHFTWVIPGIVFVAVVGLSMLRFLAHLPPRNRWAFILAGAIYVGGALGMEMIDGYYAAVHGKKNLTYELMTCVEETLEMTGVVVFVHALLTYLQGMTAVVELRFPLTDSPVSPPGAPD